MLIAGACCCGSDEPPPPTCLDCPKPDLRLFFSYRGEAANIGYGFMQVTKDRNLIYRWVTTPYPPRYVLTSFTETGTWFLSSSCGVTNLTASPTQTLGSELDACVAVEHPRLQTTPFYGSGLRTYTPDCCAPAVPNLPCSEILTNVYLPGIEYLTSAQSKLPAGIFLIWDGCNVYADDAAYQEVVRDPITNKVVMTYSESASWGAEKI
jgi:hypothetical protein